MAYCLQEGYGSGVSDEDDFALGISQEPGFQWHCGVMVVCVAQGGRDRVLWVDDIRLGVNGWSSIRVLCLVWRLRCCLSRSIPAASTSWCIRRGLSLTILGS
jgi:putative hemolysin